MSSSRKRALEEAEAAAKKTKGNQDLSVAVFVRDLLYILFILKDYVMLILLDKSGESCQQTFTFGRGSWGKLRHEAVFFFSP